MSPTLALFINLLKGVHCDCIACQLEDCLPLPGSFQSSITQVRDLGRVGRHSGRQFPKQDSEARHAWREDKRTLWATHLEQ